MPRRAPGDRVPPVTGGRRRARFVSLVALLVLIPCLSRAQPATLRGFVTDASDGQPLELVNVALQGAGGRTAGSITTRDGLYVIPRLVPGRYVFRASFVGYEAHVDTLILDPDETRTYNVALVPGGTELEEVVVETERSVGAARVTAGQQTVRPRDIEVIPAPDLSGDLAALVAALPGVVALGDRGGQLFIRGGEPSQNLMQLDGVLLYQPFHILGFYSAFPSDILSRTDIYAGGFGSRFGERISSVVDVTTRNGNMQEAAGAVTLSPFVSALRVEGPLVRDRLSVLASVRQSVVEEGAARLVDEPLPFRFGDVFVKLHGVPRGNSRLSAFVLQTHDRGTLGRDLGGAPPDEVRWNNLAAGLRVLLVPAISPVMVDLRTSYSRLPTELGPRDDPTQRSTIENVHLGLDATFFGETTDVDAGVSIRLISITNRLGGLYQNIEANDAGVDHVGVYVEPEYTLGGRLRVRPGLRVQFFDVRFNPFLEPRLRLVWDLGTQELSAAVGSYHQAILGLNDRRDAASVFTAWTNVPKSLSSLEDVREGRVPRAWHGILGYRATPTDWLELSVEGYYKRLTNLFISEWTAFPRFTTRLQPATGRSFGADARLEVRLPRFYGYVTYGLASTRYEAEQATLRLWYGQETLRFRPPHDRRHQVNALGSTTIFGFDVSVRWEFGSGLPFSQAVGFDGFALIDDVVSAAEIPGFRRVIYERPFNARLPAYHRLDVSVDRTFTLGRADLTVQGSLINLYDRRNLFYLDVFTLRRVDQLPLIPSFGLKLEVP